MKRAIVMSPADNVATTLDDLEARDMVAITSAEGERLQELNALRAIPFGHKIARYKLAKETEVVKYGEVFGVASQDIEPGDYVHVHNVRSARFSVSETAIKGGK